MLSHNPAPRWRHLAAVIIALGRIARAILLVDDVLGWAARLG